MSVSEEYGQLSVINREGTGPQACRASSGGRERTEGRVREGRGAGGGLEKQGNVDRKVEVILLDKRPMGKGSGGWEGARTSRRVRV